MATFRILKAKALFGTASFSGNVTVAGSLTVTGSLLNSTTVDVTIGDGKNLIFGSTNGTKIGTTGSKLALYGATPILQPSRLGQLTDSSGGTSGGATIAAVAVSSNDADAPKLADTRNAISTLAAKVNALETVIHNLGATA